MLMPKLISAGRNMFALAIIGLGILQFFVNDYVVARPPSPEWAFAIPGKLAWAYLSGCILIVSGLLIILHKKAEWAAIFVGTMILICSFFLRHLPDMIGNSWEGILWNINAYKSFVFFGGALIVAASFFREKDYRLNKTFTNDLLIRIGRIILSFFLVLSGTAHFKFADFVPSLIPDYIPGHTFWTYYSGTALIAAGAGLIFKGTREWASALSGLMIFLWFILLHIPRALSTPGVYDEWMGVCESLAFSGILFLLTGLFHRKRSRRRKIKLEKETMNVN
jgi:uncharacterized membrane protein